VSAKTIKVSNVWGLPFVNAKVVAQLKAKDLNVVMCVEKLFETKLKGRTVVIDQFGKLVACGIPILGYQRGPTGVWRKVPADMKPNEVEIQYPKFIGATDPFKAHNAPEVDLDLMLEFQAAKTDKEYKKLAKKYGKQMDGKTKDRKFKWFGRAVRDQIVKPPDEDAPVNKGQEE
jgi:hypothetical protein